MRSENPLPVGGGHLERRVSAEVAGAGDEDVEAVASMLFALFVLHSTAADRSTGFNAAAFVVLASILAHGLTDTVGARWIERRVQSSGR